MLNRKLLVVLVLSAGLAATAGAAPVIKGTVTVIEVAPRYPGTFDNNPLGATTGFSHAFYDGAVGPISFTTAADTLGVVQGTGCCNNFAAPALDKTHFVYGVGGPTTVTFLAPPVHSFLIYWGSIDAKGQPAYRYDNVLTLSNGDTITGSDLLGSFSPPVQGSGDRYDGNDNKWFLISDAQPFTSFSVASSGVSAYEFDMAVPEPSVWTMMLVGFGAIGLMLRAFRKKRVPLAV